MRMRSVSSMNQYMLWRLFPHLFAVHLPVYIDVENVDPMAKAAKVELRLIAFSRFLHKSLAAIHHAHVVA